VRHPADMRMLFDLLVGENIKHVNVAPETSRVRFYYMEDDGGSPLASPIDPEMKNAMKKAIQFLERKYGIKSQVKNHLHLTTVIFLKMSRIFPKISLPYVLVV